MFAQSRSVLAMLAAFCVVVGMVLDSVSPDAQAACDNQCRMRQMHYDCSGGSSPPYTKWRDPSCMWCQPGFTVRCQYNNDAWTNCGSSGQNILEYYNSGTPVCACGGGVTTIEAQQVYDFQSGVGATRYSCSIIPAGG